MTTAPTPTRPLTETQAAEMLGMAPQTLSNWRSQGKGPAYIKIGYRIRYRLADLEHFINGNIRNVSAAAPQAA